VTTRPQGDSAQRLLAGARAVGGVVLELPPWDESEALRYAREVLGVEALDPVLADQVRGAGGWPLLVDELVAAWRRGSPRGESGFLRLEALVVERLATLSPAERQVVVRAALLGSEPDSDVLESSFAGSADVAQGLGAAVRAGLMVQRREGGSTLFRHDLVREAVLADVVDVERRSHAEKLLQVFAERSTWSWRWRQVAALATLLGRIDLAVEACLDGAESTLSSGSPLAAAALADHGASLAHGPAKVRALALSVRAHALSGDVGAALAAGKRFDAAHAVDPQPYLLAEVLHARARALGLAGRWHEALRLLDGKEASSIRSLALLETGDLEGALTTALSVLDTVEDPASRCEAMEVAGRIARGTDLEAAERWFARAVAQAESAQLPLWRARALHELATISQVRRLEVDPLYEARDAALAAGAAGLLTSIDFHIAAVHGVRFEPEPALVAARRLLTDARRLGLQSQEAWAWILIAQAHAVAGERLRSEQALQDATALADEDDELVAMTSGMAAIAALIDDDREAMSPLWLESVQRLRRCAAPAPLPPWYLWPLLATLENLEGDGGARARAEVADSGLLNFMGLAGLARFADAVAAGRLGDRAAATDAWREGMNLVDQVPAFVGWLHLTHLLVSPTAHAGGWGEPGVWVVDAEGWFAAHGLTRLVSACRSLGRQIGVPQRRRGRGVSEVPAHLERLGVTSREMDVLLLVVEGLTNAEVAERLVVSPGTVKGYVERLLAKTGAANRTGLAAYLVER
jgi:DNA-binding CsgD family transcriptional regulator